MKLLKVLVVLVTVGCICVPSAFAFYNDNDVVRKSDQAPVSIIVKVKSEVPISFSLDKSGVRKSGLKSLDAVSSKYSIEHQDFLFSRSQRTKLSSAFQNVIIIKPTDDSNIEALIEEYRSCQEVEYVEPDYQMELYERILPPPAVLNPNDPLYPYQWGMNNTGQSYYEVNRIPGANNDELVFNSGQADADIDAQEVLEEQPDNTTPTILAILDTGIDVDHPDLAGKLWINPREIENNGIDDDHNGYIDDYYGYDFAGDTINLTIPLISDPIPNDEHGHGTHCAGIAAATINNSTGIASFNKDVKIMSLDFFPIMLSSSAAQAIIYATDNGADVISMSFGYPWPIQLLQDAIDYAHSKNVVLCAASGNDGTAKLNYPAACEGVITVAATNSSDNVTEFSTFGDHVNIAAPGMSILSLRANTTDMYGRYPSLEPGVHIISDYYYIASGTSMACPLVASAAAYIRSVSPGLSPDLTRQILETTADDIGDVGYDIYAGHGRLNINSAILAVPELRARISNPLPNEMFSGTISIEGIADGAEFTSYVLEYGEGLNPSTWTEIQSSSNTVTNGLLGEWDTDNLNGQFVIRLRVNTDNISLVNVYITNNSIAQITSPQESESIMMWIDVIGTASCNEFKNYTVEYGYSSSPSEYFLLENSFIPVVNGNLTILNCEGIVWKESTPVEGEYTLRVSVYDDNDVLTAQSLHLVDINSLFLSENAWKVSFDTTISPLATFGDIDNDLVNEIIVGTAEGLVVLNPDGTIDNSALPALPPFDFTLMPAIGDLDGDGLEDLVCMGREIAGSDTIAHLYGFPSTDPPFIVSSLFQPSLEKLSGSYEEGSRPILYLKDIDGDGKDEIHYGTGMHGTKYIDDWMYYYMLDSDGSLLQFIENPTEIGDNKRYLYLSADINDNGLDEFFLLNSDLCRYDENWVLQDCYDMSTDFDGYFFPESMSARDIDGDNKLDLIVLGIFLESTESNYWIFVFDENLNLKDTWPRDTKVDKGLLSSQPVFVDMDRDGDLEYFVTLYEYSQTFVFGWNLDGTEIHGSPDFPLFSVPPYLSRLVYPVFGDVTGDLLPELISYGLPDIFGQVDIGSIMAWDYVGEMADSWPTWPIIVAPAVGDMFSGGVIYSPTIGDIDDDGFTDLVVATHNREITYTNFSGVSFDELANPVPCWRYNRRLNNVVDPVDWICGDANSDLALTIDDINFLIAYIYQGGPAPNPLQSGDANGDCVMNILDLTYLINYMYHDGPEPICDCEMAPESEGPISAMRPSAKSLTGNIYCLDADDGVDIIVNSPVSLGGLQLELAGNDDIIVLSGVDGVKVYGSLVDGKGIYGLLDPLGKVSVGHGVFTVAHINDRIEILSAMGFSPQGEPVELSVGEKGADVGLPTEYALRQNYPNPFNPTTTISYDLPKSGNVKLEIFNILGQNIRMLVDNLQDAGSYQIFWDGLDDTGARTASGIYFYKLSTEGYTDSRKMLLIK